MQVCRTMHRYTEKQIADKLGMSLRKYIELEMSAVAMTPEQAAQLSAVYYIDAEHFLESSRQLELLFAREEVIRHKESELERLRQFIFVNKNKFLDSKPEDEIEDVDKNVDHEQETTR